MTPPGAATLTPEGPREALARPDCYPQHPDRVEVRETHISWVFLVGDRAYKLKKPLVLPFLDYGTSERRREMCMEEVRLNRRLAHGVYLGVLGVALDGVGGFRFVADDDPEAVDYVVEMRRYDERQTLAAKLASNTLDRDEIVAVAQTIAAFHEGAQVVHSRERPVMAAERRFELNAHELMLSVDHANELGRVLALERFAHAFITAHADTLEARTSGGLVREGHGDIRAEHVLLVGGVQIVDCVEFDRALRELDVADDLAFLVVDLFANGGSELADQLVNAYRRAGGDTGGDALIAFYAAYRALVRAKVALIRSQQRGPNGPDSQAGRSEAGRLLALAESFAWRARLPLVIVVCGVPASGKSHLTRAIGAASGLPQLSADATRKRLLGIGQNERAPEEAYTKQFNGRTYAELGDAASVAVATRRGAIVDATFRHRADREAFTQAFANAGPLLYVECQAPAAVLVTRAMDRDRSSDRLSDADVSVVRRERSSWEPLDEVTPAAHVAIRTDRTTDAVLADLMALLDRRLAALQPAQ